MNKLQRWFEVLAGVNQDAIDRLDLAYQIYASPKPDLSPLEIPACWRRAQRVRRCH